MSRQTSSLSNSYRREDTRRLIGLIESDGYGSLTPDDFHKALKWRLAFSEVPAELIKDLEDRMAKGEIGSRELFVILLTTPDSADWKLVKSRAIEFLFAHCELSSSILTQADNLLVCDIVSHQLVGSVDDKGKGSRHSVIAKVASNGEFYTSPPATASRLNRAKQLANCALLAHMAKIDPSSPKLIGKLTEEAGPILMTEGDLNDLCRRRKFPFPEITISRCGSVQTGSFEATASVTIGGITYQSVDCPANTKKEARRLAIHDLYLKIKGLTKP